MSYIDAMHMGSTVLVSERKNGRRSVKKYKAPYFFYAQTMNESASEHYISMFGDKLDKYEFDSRDEMFDERDNLRSQNIKTFESDIKTEYKVLEIHYADKPAPDLHVAIIDIEVNTIGSKGWASFENPYAEITAISIARLWLKDTITLALRPSHISLEEATQLLHGIPDTLVFEEESELLKAFLILINDADVTTGWNSEKFDMPYIVARIRVILGGENVIDIKDKNRRPSETSDLYLKKLCLFGWPRRGSIDEFNSGVETVVYSFPGKPHLDYLKLYKKFVLEPRDSYRLDNILWVELRERKVKYEGTLENLYKNNFRLYIEYNRQDVNGIVGLDDKLGLISIANEMAHQSCVFLSDAIGSVTKIEQAIVHLIHKMGFIACDKPKPSVDSQVAGAYVLDPRPGMYDWCCNFDVKSEYPNTIIMLNISPETLIGQFDTPETNAVISKSKNGWRDFTGVLEYHSILDPNDFASDLTFRFNDGSEPIKKSPEEWNNFFSKGGFSLTANGTVFSTEREGYIPILLRKWFSERKEYQSNAKKIKRQLEDFINSMPIIEDSGNDDFDITVDDDEVVE